MEEVRGIELAWSARGPGFSPRTRTKGLASFLLSCFLMPTSQSGFFFLLFCFFVSTYKTQGPTEASVSLNHEGKKNQEV